jgi:hypothetical protein
VRRTENPSGAVARFVACCIYAASFEVQSDLFRLKFICCIPAFGAVSFAAPLQAAANIVGGFMTKKYMRLILACFSMVFLLATSTPGQKEQKKNKGKEKPAAASTDAASEPALTDKFKALEFREIGPAVMGGRIDDFAAVESNPTLFMWASRPVASGKRPTTALPGIRF